MYWNLDYLIGALSCLSIYSLYQLLFTFAVCFQWFFVKLFYLLAAQELKSRSCSLASIANWSQNQRAPEHVTGHTNMYALAWITLILRKFWHWLSKNKVNLGILSSQPLSLEWLHGRIKSKHRMIEILAIYIYIYYMYILYVPISISKLSVIDSIVERAYWRLWLNQSLS